jgi:hypothetical protein
MWSFSVDRHDLLNSILVVMIAKQFASLPDSAAHVCLYIETPFGSSLQLAFTAIFSDL